MNMNADTPSALTHICPMHKYNLLDDGTGNLVLVSADAWAAAYYHAHT